MGSKFLIKILVGSLDALGICNFEQQLRKASEGHISQYCGGIDFIRNNNNYFSKNMTTHRWSCLLKHVAL